MIISDLNHLEGVSEESSIAGGLFSQNVLQSATAYSTAQAFRGYATAISIAYNVVQYGFANVMQSATAYSTAQSFSGDATAISIAYNRSVLG
jgi:hypothetical protein